MQDPKIKDRGCLTDGCDRRAIEGKYCPSCTLKNIKSKRVSKFIIQICYLKLIDVYIQLNVNLNCIHLIELYSKY